MRNEETEVVVIGAGGLGGWAALHLREAGVRTLLLDAWGSGHARSSSGGETRIIRTAYGGKELYSDWAWMAMDEWRRRERIWGSKLFVPCGILWIGDASEEHLAASGRALDRLGIPHQMMDASEVGQRFPYLRMDSVEAALHEPQGGALMSRRACQRVLQAFREAGGSYRIASVLPPQEDGALSLRRIRLSDGGEVRAEAYLFACGAWLPSLFPSLLGGRIRTTRQDVFFFGLPAGSVPLNMPAWYDFSHDRFYGVPPISERGLKVASDLDGPPFDPSCGDRTPDPRALKEARSYLERRFPSFAGAPLLESRVCQYERTPDHDFIIDRHPDWKNVFLLGGGSGHGFKHGPIAGRLAADLVLGHEAEIPSDARLSRFNPI